MDVRKTLHLFRMCLQVLFDPFKTVIIYMEGNLGILLRRLYYRTCLGSMGKKVRIDPGVYISNPEYIHMGDHVWIDRGVKLIAGPPSGVRPIKCIMTAIHVPLGTLKIGNYCHIGPDVVIQAHCGVEIGSELTIGAGSKIYTLSHHYRNPDDDTDETLYRFVGLVEPELQFLISGSVVVEDRAAVAMNAILLPGSMLATGAWITAGSVLRGSVPPGGIASGNPAKTIKYRPGYKLPCPGGKFV